MKKLVGVSLLCLLLLATLLLERPGKARTLNSRELARMRGGVVCADKVIDLASGCDGRTFFGGDLEYKCSGTQYDQGCTQASTNTNNVCNTGSASCSGPQWARHPGTQTWLLNSDTCDKVTYTTARLQAGTCTPKQ